MAQNKKKTSFTLSETAIEFLGKLAEMKGVSMASYIEMLIREQAKREKLL